MAAPFDTSGRDWQGLSDFMDLAREDLTPARVVATSTLSYDTLRREDGVVLVHPQHALDIDSLSRFMHDGGRVIVLDDFGTSDELLRHFGIERTALPAHPALMLRGKPAFAIAEPADEDGAHPAVRGVRRVVLNHATGLKHPDLSPLLQVRGAGSGRGVLVAMAGAVGAGRLLAVGDSSIVINGMLRYPGNRTFARNVIEYAVEDDAAWSRHGKLYVVSGDFAQTGSFGDASLSGRLKGHLHAIAEMWTQLRDEGAPPLVAYLLAIAVGLGLVLWVGSRAGRVHRAIVPRYTRAVPLAAQGGVAGHAAVVAAPGTTRALAVLEIKSAVEEEMASLLGMDRAPAPDALAQSAQDRGLLSARAASALRVLLKRMGEVETLVLSRRAEAMRRVHDAEVVLCSNEATRILAEARENAAHYADGPALS